MKKIIFILIDGFGIPNEGWENSIYKKYCPDYFMKLLKEKSVPIDTSLGIEGIPQSATGQTSIFTGINAAKLSGRHLTAFPGKRLKKIISDKNILKTIHGLKLRPVFANAYVSATLEKIYNSRYCSVTTAMLYSIQNNTFSKEDLIKNKCVYHDITVR